MHGKVDPAVLAALPPSMQLDLLVQASVLIFMVVALLVNICFCLLPYCSSSKKFSSLCDLVSCRWERDWWQKTDKSIKRSRRYIVTSTFSPSEIHWMITFRFHLKSIIWSSSSHINSSLLVWKICTIIHVAFPPGYSYAWWCTHTLTKKWKIFESFVGLFEN